MHSQVNYATGESREVYPQDHNDEDFSSYSDSNDEQSMHDEDEEDTVESRRRRARDRRDDRIPALLTRVGTQYEVINVLRTRLTIV